MSASEGNIAHPEVHAIQPSQNDGHSLIEALMEKYMDDSSNDADDTFVEIYVPASAPGKKGSGIVVPSLLSLDNHNISRAGSPDELQKHCAHVTELDLTLNNLRHWSEVFTIIDNLPKLQFLNLTSNTLREINEEGVSNMYDKIRSLVLNKTMVSWSTVDHLLRSMPCLQELHLSLNDYTSVELEGRYESLHTLHLNASLITQWREIVKLGRAFPNLSTLVIAETNFNTFDSTAEEIAQVFPALKVLNMSKTSVKQWEELDKLNYFPQLSSVRLLGIPLLHDLGEKKRRQLVIATIANVTKLNGSSVYDVEREDAERAYIRHFMSSDKQTDRLQVLEKKYGKLDPLAKISLKPKNEVLVTVDFEGKIVQNIKIDTTETVLQLKRKFKTLTGQPVSNLRLSYKIADAPIAHEMKYPSRLLHNYRLQDGDIIYIELKKLPTS